ncbi:uncharacterized protein PEZ65_021847 [Lycodopsis pacificus]
MLFSSGRGAAELLFFVMDHPTSGQHSQPSHTSSLQWLSFAYQSLTEIPYETILPQTDSLEVLDLSYNLLDDLKEASIIYKVLNGLAPPPLNEYIKQRPIYIPCLFPQRLTNLSSLSLPCCPSFLPYWNPALLGQLEKLSTLILDCNNYTSHIKFPYMPSVTTVCINKNKINNLPVFVEEIRRKFPNMKILSMMNNGAAPSYFNGGSLTQYEDYRQYVISQIPGLEILDDTEVLEKERVQANKTYRLQQSSHSSRKKKHTHMQNKPNTVRQ